MTIIKKGPNEPPSKIGAAFSPFTGIKEEMKSEAITGPAKESDVTSSPTLEFSNQRKKVVGAGILIICIASMIHASNERESPSIGWMLALCASWSLIVWLWPERFNKPMLFSNAKTCVKWCVCAWLVAMAVHFGVYEAYHSKLAVEFHREKASLESRLSEERSAYTKTANELAKIRQDMMSFSKATIDLRDAATDEEFLIAAKELRSRIKR